MKQMMEDVAEGRPSHQNMEWPLSKVGMEKIACQVRLNEQLVPASASAFVSLTAASKRGIHMSRLFELVTNSYEKPMSREWIDHLLSRMLESHAGISEHAYLEFQFDLMLLRKALISEKRGWRAYPVHLKAEKTAAGLALTLDMRVQYSSTCPCSASLSRQVIQEEFTKSFAAETVSVDEVRRWLGRETSIAAVPHAQRSEALGRFRMTNSQVNFDFEDLIDRMENALGTPVQTAVKREDEQEFARRNAQNLMFCEDAARRLKAAFAEDTRFEDFFFQVKHFESLHPHDVVAELSK